MPEKETIERAREDAREGKSPSTQAGEFVREEIHHVREGKHGASSAKQAIAIGLSKARRAGVKLPPPKTGTTSKKTRKSAQREPRNTASGRALSRQARSAAGRRSSASRSAAAKKAARTKGRSGRSAAAKKAARTRARRK